MKMIDCHYHNRQWLEGEEDFIEVEKRYRRECGIGAVNALSLTRYGGQGKTAVWQNIMAAILKLEDKAVYAQGALFYPEPSDDQGAPEYDLKEQVREMMALGLDGVKMLESKPNIYKRLTPRIDSTYYEEYFDYLEKEQIPLLWHVADPKEFWDEEKVSENAKVHGWFYGDGTFPSLEQIYGEVYTVLEKHPGLVVIFAHCFFKSHVPEQIIQLFETYEKVYIDLTPGPEMYRDFTEKRELWKEIFQKYPDRILFGTDVDNMLDLKTQKRLVEDIVRFLTTEDTFTGIEYYGEEYAYHLYGLGLEPEILDRVFGQNFTGVLGKKPREINRQALKDYIARYHRHIPEGKTREMILEYYRTRLGGENCEG